MPDIDHVQTTAVGPKGTGLVFAPVNMRSALYRLIQDPTFTADDIDWNASPSLASLLGDDVLDQGPEGSCVAHMMWYMLRMMRALRGVELQAACRNWLYFWGRVKAGLIDPNDRSTWKDTGTWAEAVCDVALNGYPAEALDPYVPDPTRRPPAALDADTVNRDDLLAHRGIFRDDPGGLEGGIQVALLAKMPVGIGMYWGPQFNTPDNRGFISSQSAAGASAGHELIVWKRIPKGVIGPDWYAIARQSWGRSLTAGRQFPDPEMIPGDIIIPGVHFSNGTVMDIRAGSIEKVPDPGPAPDPEPQPGPTPAPPADDLATRMRSAIHAGCDPIIAMVHKYPTSAKWRYELAGAETIRDAGEAVWRTERPAAPAVGYAAYARASAPGAEGDPGWARQG